ncbi:MAG: hypothetical protein Q7S21_01220, partial [archaeon]|nr:hypothetical protein [archaeon]
MSTSKPRLLLIEIPEVKVTYEIDGKEEVYSAVRTNYPKQSQLIIAGMLRDLCEVEIIDMKLDDSKREELFKLISYGNGIIKCYKVGASFDSIKNKIINSDIVGLTSNFTRSAGVLTDFIKYIKNTNPKTKIIVG